VTRKVHVSQIRMKKGGLAAALCPDVLGQTPS
jgi:hypothetical protein